MIGGIVPDTVLSPLIESLRAPEAAARDRRLQIVKAEVDLKTPALGGAALPLFNGLSPAVSLLHK